jgi:hypothetical protein
LVLDRLRAGGKAPSWQHAAQASGRREGPVVMFVLTPGGRFKSMASPARHHNVSRATVLRYIRNGLPGWQFEAPYQIPAGFVPSGAPWRKHGPRKREDRT